MYVHFSECRVAQRYILSYPGTVLTGNVYTIDFGDPRRLKGHE